MGALPGKAAGRTEAWGTLTRPGAATGGADDIPEDMTGGPGDRGYGGAPAAGGASGQVARVPPHPSIRLTGRGGMLAIFALSFVGAFLASLFHFGPLAGASYLAACLLTTWTVRNSQLLLVVVTPPMLFAAAVACVQLLTASGGTLSAIGGTVVTLGNVAPWLFAGCILGIAIALVRGLAGNVRELRQGLRGDPADPDDQPHRVP